MGEPKTITPAGVVVSWALYDFANTIFSMNVVSRYFPLWVTDIHHAPDIYYSVALSVSMLAVAVALPVLGAISDNTGRRVPPLFLFTALCCVMTAGISFVSDLMVGLLLFAVANFSYQASLVYYDGLLPSVATGRSVSRVAGLGVSLGYIGAIVGLGLLIPVVAKYGEIMAFGPTALLFLLFSIPCFIMVKDPPVNRSEERIGAFDRLRKTFRESRKNRSLFIFIIAIFFILDGVNTVIAFMSIYAHSVFKMEGAHLTIFLMLATVGAAVGALGWGWISATLGPLKALKLVCAAWLLTLTATVCATGDFLPWLIGPMAGMALGGVWVAGRALLVQLAPREKIGEFFGLFNMAGKAASISGPLVWGVTVALFEPLGGTIKHRLAVASLALFIGTGWWLLTRINDPANMDEV